MAVFYGNPEHFDSLCPAFLGHSRSLEPTWIDRLTFLTNQGPITYRFRDKRRLLSKIAKFPEPIVDNSPAEGVSLEFCNVNHSRTRRWKNFDDTCIVSIQCQSVTDRDRQTDRFVRKGKGKGSSLVIAPLTVVDSGALQPRKCQLIGTGCSTTAQTSGCPLPAVTDFGPAVMQPAGILRPINHAKPSPRTRPITIITIMCNWNSKRKLPLQLLK